MLLCELQSVCCCSCLNAGEHIKKVLFDHSSLLCTITPFNMGSKHKSYTFRAYTVGKFII